MKLFLNELRAQSSKHSKLTHKAAAVTGFTVGNISQRIPMVDVTITIRDKSKILDK